jgi:O-antigen/teichoic acid export membrane protein
MSGIMTTAPQASLASIARHGAVYSIAPILQRVIALVLVRFYTHELNVEQWGVTSITDLVLAALTQIAGLNLLSGMLRFYFDHEDERDRNAVVSSATLFLMGVSWLLVGLGLLLRGPLTPFLFDTTDPLLANDDLNACLSVSLLVVPFALTSEAGFRYLQIHKRSSLLTTIRVTKVTLEILLRIWMILVLQMGVIGFLLPTLIGEALTSTALTGWVLWRVRLRYVWPILRPMLVYTAPLVFVGFCQMGLHLIDRLMVRQLAPDEVEMTWTGIHGLGHQIGFLVQLVVVGSFMQIWQPHVFGMKDPEEQGRQIARVSTYAFLFISAVSLGLMAFGREVVNVLVGGEDYYPAYRVVPWIVAGYACNALNGLSQVPMFVAKRTRPMAWINATALAVNVVLNFVLIPRLGLIGAPVAKLCTFACLAAMGLWVAGSVVREPFELGRFGAILGAVAVGLVGVLWIDARFPVAFRDVFNVPALYKAGLLTVLLAFLWLVVLRRDERRELTGFALQRLRPT